MPVNDVADYIVLSLYENIYDERLMGKNLILHQEI